jgi:hypothetical protein
MSEHRPSPAEELAMKLRHWQLYTPEQLGAFAEQAADMLEEQAALIARRTTRMLLLEKRIEAARSALSPAMIMPSSGTKVVDGLKLPISTYMHPVGCHCIQCYDGF